LRVREQESVESHYLGIDVAKAHLDVALLPSGESQRFANEAHGHAELVDWARERAPKLTVLEATGGYEAAAAAELAAVGLRVAVVNPRQVRAFAQAIGQTAKTDTLDAVVLARFAQAIQPAPRALPDALTQDLLALVERRRELVTMRTAETNRLSMGRSATVTTLLRAHVAWLNEQLRQVEQALLEAVEHNPTWCATERLLRSVPGVGQTTATVLLAELPELGLLSRQQLAALVGSHRLIVTRVRSVADAPFGLVAPACGPPSTWRRSPPPAVIRSSVPSTRDSAPWANPRRWRSPPACANC
jgi:transposase